MWDEILEAFVESLIILGVLLVVHILIEIAESKTAGKWKYNKALKGKYAPLIGGAVGLIPQCGFSVVATDLYTKNIIGMGTLLAVYLSTSDEALPIMLSSKEGIKYLLPMLAIKFVVALLVGYTLYLIMRNRKRANVYSTTAVKFGKFGSGASIDVRDSAVQQNYLVADIHMDGDHDKGCCGHDIENDAQDTWWHKYLLHPLVHSLKIFAFVLVVNIALNIVMYYAGDSVIKFLGSAYYVQPIVAGLVGLIPNCAASVIVTQLFVEGALSFGACMAGLCANAGIALAVLIKQNTSKRDTLTVIGVLYGVSVAVGMIISLIMRAL